jgi:hypothetical protein
MLWIIAQVPTSQPAANKWETWVIVAAGVVFVIYTVLLPKLIALVRGLGDLWDAIDKLRRDHDTNKENIAGTAKIAEGIGQAVNTAPGLNVPAESLEALRQIAEAPEIKAPVPASTDPVPNPATPTVPPPQPRAFDGSKPE